MELRFDEKNPIEMERAKRAIIDMLNNGYALFVTDDQGNTERVKAFLPDRNVYLIADVPVFGSNDRTEPVLEVSHPKPSVSEPPQRLRGSRRRYREVKATEAKVTAVGRSAGG